MPEGETAFAPSREGLSVWQSETLTDESLETLFQAIKDRREGAIKDADVVRRLGKVFGLTGSAVGVIGMLAGWTVYVKTPVPQPPGYILVHTDTGAVDPPVSAVDAPRIFPETTRERALRDLIVNCESYIPQSFADIDYHACMINATPAEQRRLEADIGPKGVRYPPAVFGGDKGWALPVAFNKFTDKGDIGSGDHKYYHFEVRYERAEIINGGHEQRIHYTAIVDFSFHPELKMSPADRLINPYGLQIVAYSTTPD